MGWILEQWTILTLTTMLMNDAGSQIKYSMVREKKINSRHEIKN